MLVVNPIRIVCDGCRLVRRRGRVSLVHVGSTAHVRG